MILLVTCGIITLTLVNDVNTSSSTFYGIFYVLYEVLTCEGLLLFEMPSCHKVQDSFDRI